LSTLLDQRPTILARPYLSVRASETVGTPAMLLVDKVAAALALPRAPHHPPPAPVLLRPHIFDDDVRADLLGSC